MLKRAKSPVPGILSSFDLNLLFLVVILNSFSNQKHGGPFTSVPPPPFYFIQARSPTSIASDRPPLRTNPSVPKERLSSTIISARIWRGGTIIRPPQPLRPRLSSPFRSHTHHPLRGSRLPWATAACACALHPSYVERSSRVLSGRSKAKEGLDSRNTAHWRLLLLLLFLKKKSTFCSQRMRFKLRRDQHILSVG